MQQNNPFSLLQIKATISKKKTQCLLFFFFSLSADTARHKAEKGGKPLWHETLAIIVV